ncbi:hypothetical protein UG55_108139 [Frankia sp. EI5c]|uniref:hypothetical protein n=1 Tax=Frankia sp. EI5c TaxID=683316 RepID=UPI0007C3CDE0|nr:hypothetical protein [Frankia sp. EI5c]OAA20125.1 hypothetical protein UG55_108139 [Frankia sp. EI5c]
MSPQSPTAGHETAAGLRDTCLAALHAAVANYETVDLAVTAATLEPLEETTRTIPQQYRLRGRPAIDWMWLHAAVTTAAAAAAYDRGQHARAASRADRAASLARAAGDGPLAARALALRARVVRPHSPSVALQIAGSAARIAGRSPTRALIAGKVATSACAAAGDTAGVRDAVARAWATMAELGEEMHGRPGFSLDTYSPADLALACAEALTTVGAADEATPYLDRAASLIARSGQTGMIVSVRMAQSRAAVARAFPDRDEAIEHASEAVALAARRPAEWVARLVRDVSDLAEIRTGHGFDDLVAVTSTWISEPEPAPRPGAGGAADFGAMVPATGATGTVPAPRRAPRAARGTTDGTGSERDGI